MLESDYKGTLKLLVDTAQAGHHVGAKPSQRVRRPLRSWRIIALGYEALPSLIGATQVAGRTARRWGVFLGCGVLLGPVGSPPLPRRVPLPAGTLASATVVLASASDTAVSAARRRAIAVSVFEDALSQFIWDSGLLTDELRSPLNGLRDLPPDANMRALYISTMQWFAPSESYRVSLRDQRILPESLTDQFKPNELHDDNPAAHGSVGEWLHRSYENLQDARVALSLVRRQLAAMPASAADRAVIDVYRGELYALEGYAELMLADYYCSGVPLNTFAPPKSLMQLTGASVSYYQAIVEKRVTFHPGSTTAQVYQTALAKFDTALALGGDSARIVNLARVGKGRAWLALGQYDSAAAAVAQVPKGFVSLSHIHIWNDPDGGEVQATVADREGFNGHAYLSSGDPRSAVKSDFTDKVVWYVALPAMFHANGGCCSAQVPLASWEEVMLIRAEANLHKMLDTPWLQLLNELRATAPIPGTTQPDPDALHPLADPGDPDGQGHDMSPRAAHDRIALLFAERAAWLFMTGHRQGDLRRLVREYHWPQDRVYPTGPYIVPKALVRVKGRYGSDVNMPISPLERANPYFHGCLNRGA